MRDPEGQLEFSATTVTRRLYQALPPDHFLLSDLAKSWVERGDLVPFEASGPRSLISPRLPFVSHPTEWTDAHLFAAAKLTARLNSEANANGYELKDASAWNVLFDGVRPVFCDHLSFVRMERQAWWAAGQFSRHFVFPLLASRYRGILTHECFRTWRDGVPSETMRRLLGPGRFALRQWPLMADADDVEVSKRAPRTQLDATTMARRRHRLHVGLDWMLVPLQPREAVHSGSQWRLYADAGSGVRSHYDDADLDLKRATVEAWLEQVRPGWVLDLGCNTGEFSRMAAKAGATVIAVDGDAPAIQRMFTSPCPPKVHPVVALLDDLQQGRGWLGEELPGLPLRLNQRCDMTLMLALLHHLVIGSAIPLDDVVDMASRFSREWLIVELLAPEDMQVQVLCQQRRYPPTLFSLESQRQAFMQQGWTIQAEVRLRHAPRVLHLMRKAKGC